jgi:hypothetical protein
MTKSDKITIEFINNPEADVNKLAKRYKTAPSYVYKMRARALQHTNDTLRDSERETAMDKLADTSRQLEALSTTLSSTDDGWQLTQTVPTSTDVILEQRGNRYGKFSGQAEISQRLKGVVREFEAKRGCDLAPDQREALEMVMHKVARIINGDPNYHDSWADIAGYAKLVADRLETGKEV